MSEGEVELRSMWNRQGIPIERQDEIIEEVTRKAQPGAWIGPFRIPGYSDSNAGIVEDLARTECEEMYA